MFFDRPYLVLFITMVLTMVFPDKYSVYSIVVICLIFIISIIYTIYQRKWLRLILSSIGYFVFVILYIVFLFISDSSNDFKPEIAVGDDKFYSNEIFKATNLKIPNDIRFVSKIDTIVYMGLENEYDAECLYTGSEKSIIELEKNILSMKDFSKINQLEKYPTKVLNQQNFNLNELKSVYKKEMEGSYKIFIAINKTNSKIYYSAVYY